MVTAGCFIDVSNLYFCLSNTYSRKLSYSKYINFLKGLYPRIVVQKAYVASNGKNMGFISALQKLGFEVEVKTVKEYAGKKKKCDMDVEIALDIVDCDANVIILGSADGDMLPVVKRAIARGKTVLVLACGISSELRAAGCQCIEIPPSLLE